MEFLLFFSLGLAISILSSFFGVGGGFILTPILLLIGFPPLEAIVTSLMFTIGTSAFGIFAHIRLKNIRWKEGMIIGLSGAAATQMARPFILYIEEQGWDGLVIPILYILLLSYFALTMFTQEKRKMKDSRRFSPSSSLFKMILIGLFGGFVSSTLGVGGGFIIVPLLISMLNLNPKKAVGTSLFAVLMIVSIGFVSYAVTVTPNYFVGGLLIIGALIGSQFGAALTTYFENGETHVWLGSLYFVTLLSVILKLFHLNMTGLVLLALFTGTFLVYSIVRMKNRKVKSLV